MCFFKIPSPTPEPVVERINFKYPTVVSSGPVDPLHSRGKNRLIKLVSKGKIQSNYDRQLKQPRGPHSVSAMKRESCFQSGVTKASCTFWHVSVEQDQTADLIKISPFNSMHSV